MGAVCEPILMNNPLIISAATLTETLIVGSRKRITSSLETVLSLLDLTVEPVTGEFAHRAATAYDRWGKGVHRAALNYGDCFSYAVAEMHGCPLLFVGDDFSQTDVRSALV